MANNANHHQTTKFGNKNPRNELVRELAQLIINKQSSLEVEKFTENGQQRNVHYVVKNTAFTFEIALVNSTCSELVGQTSLDFNKLSVQAVLLYDCPGVEKEVGCVKVDPMAYRGVVSPSSPFLCQIEAVIKILSSQHEDMNFKIKFLAVDSHNRPIPDLAPVYSDSINVISKPGVLQKIRDKQRLSSSRKAAKKNKSKSELTLDALTRIERTLTDQQAKIDLLMSERDSAIALPKLGKRSLQEFNEPQKEKDPLASACVGFLNELHNISQADRPEKIRKVRNSLSQENLSMIQEFFQDLIAPSDDCHQASLNSLTSLESLDDDIFSLLDAVLKS